MKKMKKMIPLNVGTLCFSIRRPCLSYSYSIVILFYVPFYDDTVSSP